MAFLDHIGKKISAAAGTAADKAKDLGEIAKLSNDVSSDVIILVTAIFNV